RLGAAPRSRASTADVYAARPPGPAWRAARTRWGSAGSANWYWGVVDRRGTSRSGAVRGAVRLAAVRHAADLRGPAGGSISRHLPEVDAARDSRLGPSEPERRTAPRADRVRPRCARA